MKIYTKKGDDGSTGLFGGPRVTKNAAQVDTYGEVDHLNSVIGWARAQTLDPNIDQVLERVQHELFAMGAELASTHDMLAKGIGIRLVDDTDTAELERAIDETDNQLEPLKSFILPGGSVGASALHLARTACRKVERKLVALHQHHPVRVELLRYINRLSDLLFVLARRTNQVQGVADVPWLGRQ